MKNVFEAMEAIDAMIPLGIVNVPYVIVDSYEDRRELMNKEQYFMIHLDCLIMPEEKIVVKEFFGTLAQIDELMRALDMDPWWREFYSSTLNAWDQYHAGDHGATHMVGRNVERLLTPVSELCRAACLVDDVQWRYQDKFGALQLADAATVDVHEMLLRDEYRYIRVAKYCFDGLDRTHSELGSVRYKGESIGIPYMMVTNDKGITTNRLWVVEDEYDSLNVAMEAMKNSGKNNYQQISRELFTGC